MNWGGKHGKNIKFNLYQPRNIKFNMKNPKLGWETRNQASQIFFHCMIMGLQ
jgi:hypothetical protein